MSYGEDLAFVHDAGFGDFARDAAPGLLALLRATGVRGGRVVDLGCGSGIWAAELVRAGYEVLGVDASAAMLELARRRAPAARFEAASLWTCELPDCDGLTAIGEVLAYRGSGKAGGGGRRDRLRAFFRRAFRALRPGGVLVFDLVRPGAAGPRRAWREGEGWAVLVEVSEARRRLVRDIVTYRATAQGYRRRREVHSLWTYEPAEVLGWLRAAGFRARPRRGYGSLSMLPGRTAYVARKPV